MFQAPDQRKKKTRCLDRRIDSHFENKYLKLTIREIKKNSRCWSENRFWHLIYFSFRGQCIRYCQVIRVENEIREKPSGQYDQTSNKWPTNFCLFLTEKWSAGTVKWIRCMYTQKTFKSSHGSWLPQTSSTELAAGKVSCKIECNRLLWGAIDDVRSQWVIQCIQLFFPQIEF